MVKKGNQYIEKSKKNLSRKRKRRKLLILTVLTVGVCAGIAFKTSIFNIKNIKVTGQKNLTENQVLEISEYIKGENLFLFNSSDVLSKIKVIPYVDEVNVKKKIPNTIVFDMKEKSAAYYAEKDKEFCILSPDMQILDKVSELDIENVIEIDSFGESFGESGTYLREVSERELGVLETIGKINNLDTVDKKITRVDTSDLINIKVYIGEIEVILGDDSDIIDKMEIAFDILNTSVNIDEAKFEKGYIDVRVVSSPVIKPE